MNRKYVSIIIFFLMITIVCNNSIAFKQEIQKSYGYKGDIIYVDDDNILGPWDGTEEHPYRYFHEGVIAASNGDTIFVFEGMYESGDIDKSIQIIGENKELTLLDALPVFIASNISIEGFTLNSNEGIGIEIKSNNNTIRNNIFTNNMYGIAIHEGKKNNIIEGNIFVDNFEVGILLNDCHYTQIKNNVIIRTDGIGIELDGHSDCSNNEIFNNIICNNNEGIAVSGYATQNKIINNLIVRNDKNGILLEYCVDNTIRGNTIRFNLFGIFIEYAFNNTITNNNFLCNLKAINLVYDIYIGDILTNTNKITRNFPRPFLGVLVIIGNYPMIFILPYPMNMIPRLIPYKGFDYTPILSELLQENDFENLIRGIYNV